ncbi:hypothetical protein [Curtobacterium sp. ME12]|uniref:hypothetical protein n=1 Tax=Curtobacterium sp. ME12 TaxID=2744253 RepID=UPI001C71123E|nr:hypothetical protein [Curtobacterium sp. ME12]
MTPVLRWTVADEGFWVAEAEGSYAGTVDRQGKHHYVRNGYGEYIGDYATLPAAQVALAARSTDRRTRWLHR